MAIELAQLDEPTIKQLREKCLRSLFFFARAVLGFVDLDATIHRNICRELQDPINTRMMVVLPRSWFKSSMASIAYPLWRAIKNPDIRILIVQNSMANAKKKVGSIKQMVDTNGLLQVLFPEILPVGDRPWSAECLTFNRKLAAPEGTFEPAGTGTAVTSRHYDIIIQDDTVAPDFDQMTGEIQQPTQLEIEKAIGWHKMCHPLLIHPVKSQIIIVGTRWSQNDLIGWIMSNSPNYKVLSRSALEVPGHVGLPATKEQGGVAIWERFNDSVLKELELSLGPFMFSLLYLNIASASVNQIFKRSYIHYYEKLPANLIYCTSVDPAPCDSSGKLMDSDYNVVLTTGIDPLTGTVYVVHYNQTRSDPGEIIDIIFNHYKAYHPSVVKVEGVAYQRTLCYWIRKKQETENLRFYIEAVTGGRASKSARILGLEPWFAAGHVLLRQGQNDLERELMNFDPNKKSTMHDDIIDALCMQIDFWVKSMELIEEEKARDNERFDDTFDGSAILDSILERAEVLHKYPNDIGLMSERIKSTMRRQYACA